MVVCTVLGAVTAGIGDNLEAAYLREHGVQIRSVETRLRSVESKHSRKHTRYWFRVEYNGTERIVERVNNYAEDYHAGDSFTEYTIDDLHFYPSPEILAINETATAEVKTVSFMSYFAAFGLAVYDLIRLLKRKP